MSCCSQKKSTEKKDTTQAKKTCCGSNVTPETQATVKREEGGISFCECSAISACACAAEECQCANCADHKL